MEASGRRRPLLSVYEARRVPNGAFIGPATGCRGAHGGAPPWSCFRTGAPLTKTAVAHPPRGFEDVGSFEPVPPRSGYTARNCDVGFDDLAASEVHDIGRRTDRFRPDRVAGRSAAGRRRPGGETDRLDPQGMPLSRCRLRRSPSANIIRANGLKRFGNPPSSSVLAQKFAGS